jgi:hypothetical protein
LAGGQGAGVRVHVRVLARVCVCVFHQQMPCFMSPPLQEARTLEELQMQHMERQRVVRYLQYMQEGSQAAAQALMSEHQQLDAEVQASLREVAAEDAVSRCSIARQHKQQLQRLEVVWAQSFLYTEWSKYFADKAQDAVHSFGTIRV